MNVSHNAISKRTKKLFISTLLLYSLIPLCSTCAAEEEHKEAAAATDIAILGAPSNNTSLRKEITRAEANMLFESCSSATTYDEKVTIVTQMLYALNTSTNTTVDIYQIPLLIYAIHHSNKHTELIKILIELGADINKADRCGDTPLIIASQKGFSDIVRILIQYGADINKTNKINRSALLTALWHAKADVAHILIQHDADINKTDTYGNTPLAQASAKGFIDIVKILIQRGADINKATYRTNNSPLLSAFPHKDLMHKSTDIAHILIQHGADVNKINKKGRTPLIKTIQRCDDPSSSWYINYTLLLTTLILANAQYTPEQFNNFSDTIKTIIQAAEQAKKNLGHHDWLPEEFMITQSLPIPTSRAELDVRNLITEYANPIDHSNSLYTPEMCHCIVLEIQRRHNQRSTTTGSVNYTTEDKHKKSAATIDPVVQEKNSNNTPLRAAEQAKKDLGHQGWLPKEFMITQSLPIPTSRAELGVRNLIAEYANPIDHSNSLYTPEMCHCTVLEIQRRHNQRPTTTGSVNYTTEDEHKESAATIDPVVQEKNSNNIPLRKEITSKQALTLFGYCPSTATYHEKITTLKQMLHTLNIDINATVVDF